jgi:hypothetical protein
LPLLVHLQTLLQMQQTQPSCCLCWQMLRPVGLAQLLLRAAGWLTSTGSYQTAWWALRQPRLARRAKCCCFCQCQHQQQSGQDCQTRKLPALLAAAAVRLASLQLTAARQLLPNRPWLLSRALPALRGCQKY